MQRSLFKSALPLSLVALALLAVPAVEAASVLKMDLGELASRSHTIVRGRILDVESGTVAVGGSVLPTLTYTIDVSETLAGDPASFIEKDGQRMAHITMVASKEMNSSIGEFVRFSKLPEMPDLQVGQEYLLMTTQPSAAGLSTTVGLGQGCFHIDAKTETAANELANAGLSPSINGPTAYSQLADEIRARIGQ